MGRLLIVCGIGILAYDHYYGFTIHFITQVVPIVGYSLIGFGVILYLLTELR